MTIDKITMIISLAGVVFSAFLMINRIENTVIEKFSSIKENLGIVRASIECLVDNQKKVDTFLEPQGYSGYECSLKDYVSQK